MTADTETVHRCPRFGETVTSCCGRTLFELPRTDRVTSLDQRVTCGVPCSHPYAEVEVDEGFDGLRYREHCGKCGQIVREWVTRLG